MNRIKQILEEKGITQIWQDEKIDESFSQTNAYVCNRRQPRIEWLYEIASLLDVETKNLLVNNQELNPNGTCHHHQVTASREYVFH